MSYETLLLAREGRVGVITLHRPQARNALSRTLIAELGRAVDELERDEGIGAVVLTGGETYFAAGAEIRAVASIVSSTAFPEVFFGCCERVAS